MISKLDYIEYLINYTCTNLAEHLDGVSHDVISDYLFLERLTSRTLWGLSCHLIDDSPSAFLIIDDSVQDKRYSKKIDLVKRQYSGNEHGLVKGIGVVNLVHTNGTAREFYPIDYRIYAPKDDGKTKNDHFQEMLIRAVSDKRIQAKTVLFDMWYASARNLKLVARLNLTFYTHLKDNRLISLSQEEGYIHLDKIEWTKERLTYGVTIKLREVPFKVQLFKIVAPDGDIDWLITNAQPDSTLTKQVAQDASDVRWQIEELHRGVKQLTGSEKCQCRQGRSQRNHLACCYHAWLSLKVKAKELGKTLYQVRTDLFRDYLRAELRNPHVRAYIPA
jgi:hypothetical protein